MEAILPFATVIGPIVLLAVIVWAWARNRETHGELERKAEQGARELRHEIERSPERSQNL